MGLLSFLFGGRRDGARPPVKRDPGADVIRVATPPNDVKAKATRVEKAHVRSAVSKETRGPVAEVVALTPASTPAKAAAGTAPGSVQVKLRLRLAAATRAGDLEAAYEAARGLEDIQRMAGRRVGARVWRDKAERIYEAM